MKTKWFTLGLCLLLAVFSACHKNNGDDENDNNDDIPQQQVEGSLSGLFSVSSNKQVRFSQGNLQYQASTGTWRFAAKQYDCIGQSNTNISLFYQGWVDLFGWGTSGYNDVKPWLIDYDMETTSITGTKYDWGLNNAISNGGNKAGLWHLLTIDQWEYIVNQRPGSRFAKATVADVRGLMLLPDDWNEETYALNAVNDAAAGYESNMINASDWANKLEANGVVFLPCAGLREGTAVNYVNGFGRYWSSTYIEKARSLFFHQTAVRSEGADYLLGFAVRLVQDVDL